MWMLQYGYKMGAGPGGVESASVLERFAEAKALRRRALRVVIEKGHAGAVVETDSQQLVCSILKNLFWSGEGHPEPACEC